MQATDSVPEPQARRLDDIVNRWKAVGRSGLLPALIEAQRACQWLAPAVVKQIADGLSVPLAEAYGVADFYAHLYTHPVGKRIVRVCDDVACYLAGSERIMQVVADQLGVGNGETTRDGSVTFEIVPCLGHCDHAPVLMIDDLVHEQVSERRAAELVQTSATDAQTAEGSR
jgi:NADH:ubiquinone oxidoreductase subunit E